MTVERIRLFRPPRPRAKHVWAAILVGVVLHNSTAEDGDLLSEQVDQWLLAHPILTRLVVAVLAAHLVNAFPERADLVHQGFVILRWTKRRRRAILLMGAVESVPMRGLG